VLQALRGLDQVHDIARHIFSKVTQMLLCQTSSIMQLYLVRRVLVSAMLYTPHDVFATVCHCLNAR
jgi:hypothetical protein